MEFENRMLINVCFDLYASIIRCNIEGISIEEINSKLESWLYEENGMKYIGIKDNLNINVLDINVVIRFFSEVYSNSNPEIIKERINIDELDLSLPIINL